MSVQLRQVSTLFCAYAPKDRRLFEEFQDHLALLYRSGAIELFQIGAIPPGAPRKKTLENWLARADVIVFMMSSNFCADDDCWWVMERALKSRGPCVVPVRISSIALADMPISERQALPREGLPPIDALAPPDRAELWVGIVKELLSLGRILREARASDPAAVKGFSTLTHQVARHRLELGYLHMYRGQIDRAIDEFTQAQNEYESLERHSPGDVSNRQELSKVYDRIGQARYAQGNLELAEQAFARAFETRTSLAESSPLDLDLQRALCASRYWRGHLFFIKKDFFRAENENQEGIAICEQLLEQGHGDPAIQRDLLVHRMDLASVRKELEKLSDAECELRHVQEDAVRLVEQQPWNPQAIRDLSVCLFRLADVLLARHQITEAIELSRESVRRCKELTDRDSGNVQWMRHLSKAQLTLGEALEKKGELEDALKAYRTAVELTGCLERTDPNHVQWREEHASASRKLEALQFRYEATSPMTAEAPEHGVR